MTSKYPHTAGMVRVFPVIPHTEAIRTQQGSHVLLHLADPEMRGVFTGKIFEFLAARRPILSVPGDGDVVDSLLKQTKAGVSCRDVQQKTAQLMAWYDEWKKTSQVSYHGNGQEIAKYSRREQAKQLALILDSITEARPRGTET